MSKAEGIFLFPGQGAQTIGMAKDAFDAGGYAHSLFEEAGEILGLDLAAMVFNGDEETLARTENCQPALLVASLALLETLRERCTVEIRGAMGLSLGEYTALVALNVMDFADAVRLVRKRGELMEASGRGQATGMASVLGLEDEQVVEVCAQASAATNTQVVAANFNCPGQVAISGAQAGLEKAMELAKDAGAKRAIPLKVSAAFHSPFMKAAQDGLREALADVPLREPQGRFLNNADAKELTSPDEIRESLARQVVEPVRWTASCRALLASGASSFYEVGPGAVCKGLMKRIDRSATVTSVSSLAEIDALAEN